MALPNYLWNDMNISPHNTRQDYLDNWGDCQDVTQGSVYFYTQHYTANTRQHYSDENPTFQALAAREAALAHKIDKVIEAVDDDFLVKDLANDANLWLSKSSEVSVLAETSAGDAWLAAKGTTDSYLDLVNSGSTSNYRYLRLKNNSESFSIQRRSNDGSSILDIPFHIDMNSEFTIILGTLFSMGSGSKDLGNVSYPWDDFYISGDVYGSLLPATTLTYNLGGGSNYWLALYTQDLFISNHVTGNLIPSTGTLYTLGDSSHYWLTAYLFNLYVSNSVYGNLRPGTSVTYNLGDATHIWNELHLQDLYMNNYTHGNFIPSANLTDDLGALGNAWAKVITGDFYISGYVYNDFLPNNTSRDLGSATYYWAEAHIEDLYTYGIVNGDLTTYDDVHGYVGTDSNRWYAVHTLFVWTNQLIAPVASGEIDIQLNTDLIPTGTSRLGNSSYHWFSIHCDFYDPFTGSHPIMVSKEEKIEIEEGMVAISTGKVYVESFSNVIVQAEPSKESCDPRVYGIFRKPTDDPLNPKNPDVDKYLIDKSESKGTPLIVKLANENNYWSVNALGEGQMLVVSVDGKEPKNGDLLVTSRIPGYATTQTDDVFKACTIGKVTQDIDWEKVNTYVKYKNRKYKKTLIAVTYHCG